MDWVKEKVREELERGWIGPDEDCPYHPCHYRGQDCSYCFCPFYPCMDPRLGESLISSRSGKEIWSCVDCHLMHREGPCRYTATRVEELGIRDPDDPRLAEIFAEVLEKFMTRGKAVMVLGGGSDSGKSLTVAALCRIIADRRRSVAPFKSQNMSLNTVLTQSGHEVSRAQMLQAQAARMDPDWRVNPVLLKPRGDSSSEVILAGRSTGVHEAREYYDNIVLGAALEAVSDSLEFLRWKYDNVVMEGAGSPAEINLYDRDIANMRAAALADADCILVVNMRWGGAFAYAYGTLALLEPEDRARIRGILLNDVFGDLDSLRPGVEMLEELTGVPVLGVIPHLDFELPPEDSLSLAEIANEVGTPLVGIPALPRMSCFSDLDALRMDGAAIRLLRSTKDLEGLQAILIPDSADPFESMRWMEEKGLTEAVRELRGKIPILGIGAGMHMMAQEMSLGEETLPGLRLIDGSSTLWAECKSRRAEGKTAFRGEPVIGNLVRKGELQLEKDSPLLMIETLDGEEKEGFQDLGSKLFGSELHGLLDKPAFRSRLLTLADGRERRDGRSLSDYVDVTLDKVAQHFLKHMDQELLDTILGEGRA